ncbi:MAG TPA: tripartite tricarboxylate transporter TctB family protein [Anaeromyxobacteraceae bacterium]|nr:tripartite tricarboxylate transporter TctB family protein [Anaeromyxobacteraceae bacterium]
MTDERGGETARHGRVRAPQDLAAGLCLIALAGLALWAGAGLDAGKLRAMGPGMMPRAVAVLVGLVGLALVAFAFLHAGERLQRWAWRAPLFLTLGVLGFALTIRPVGLALAGPLVAVVGGAASPESRPRELAFFAVTITAFCILLFRVLLRLPIPVLNLPGLVVL